MEMNNASNVLCAFHRFMKNEYDHEEKIIEMDIVDKKTIHDFLKSMKRVEDMINMPIADFIECISHDEDVIYMKENNKILKVRKTDLMHDFKLVLDKGVVIGWYFYFEVEDRFENTYELPFSDYKKTFFFSLKEVYNNGEDNPYWLLSKRKGK